MADPAAIPEPSQTVQSSDENPMLGIMLRLAAMAVLGVMFALVKMAGNHGVHVTESLFWRQVAGLPVVVLWLWYNGNLGDIRTRKPGAHAIRATLGLTAMALNFSAMMLLPMAEATTIGFATPIFATALAALLLGEKTGKFRWAAIALGFVGVVVALQPGSGTVDTTGAIVALAGAALTAGVAIQLRRMGREEKTGAIVFWFSLSTIPPLAIAMLFFSKSHDAQTWAIIAGLATCGAVAQILLTAALRYAPVAAVLTMDYTSLIWSVLLGYYIFDDIPSHSVWLGAPLVIAAGLIIAWREQYLVRHRAAKIE